MTMPGPMSMPERPLPTVFALLLVLPPRAVTRWLAAVTAETTRDATGTVRIGTAVRRRSYAGGASGAP